MITIEREFLYSVLHSGYEEEKAGKSLDAMQCDVLETFSEWKRKTDDGENYIGFNYTKGKETFSVTTPWNLTEENWHPITEVSIRVKGTVETETALKLQSVLEKYKKNINLMPKKVMDLSYEQKTTANKLKR